jgi:pimeloyl-ACP methyl ester carboxylesterase
MLMGALYFILLYLVLQQVWVLWMLVYSPASRLLATNQNKLHRTGVTFSEKTDRGAFSITHSVEDGIERIVYTPKKHTHETPILMAHGMWHGAWCWQAWQEYLAGQGWESIAYSLPGHGKSPAQKPITFCTLSYYLAFLRDEINRLPPRKPVLMGHSMGGALSQWYLRHVNDDLPAVVLVAPWVSHSVFADCALPVGKLDPIGCLLTFVTWNTASWVRSPKTAASKLIKTGALLSPEELHKRLGPESALILFQHNPPFWKPADNVRSPMLFLAGEQDTLVPLASLERSAAHYKADFMTICKSGHNLMMEKSRLETAGAIDHWLTKNKVP